MSAASPRFLFMTGSPDVQSLGWTEEDLFGEDILLPPFLPVTSSKKRKRSPSSPDTRPAWRSIPFEKESIHNGWTQTKPEPKRADDETTFLTLRNPSFRASDTPHKKDEKSSYYEGTKEVEEYYKHSYAVHVNDASGSQRTEVRAEEDTYLTAKSSFQSSSSYPSPSDSESDSEIDPSPTPARKPIPKFGVLIDLKKIPSAAQLVALGLGKRFITTYSKQVDLVVGIVDIAPTKTVYVGKRRTRREIVEMVVADETKSGFGITLWFEPLDSKHPTGMRKTVEDLRLRDLIHLRNVGLAIFNNCVHGNSLPNNLTKIELLWRKEIPNGENGIFSASELNYVDPANHDLMKVKKVKDHFTHFIIAGLVESTESPDRRTEDGVVKKRKRPQLPPDTQ
ncbi:MAG: hypothetical protein MMC33_006565 [Icmadophila ericetorum]|nr:hypothetical protein [Icmadophila ericetorum]